MGDVPLETASHGSKSTTLEGWQESYPGSEDSEGLIAGAGEVAVCADVEMGDPVSPDRARLQHQWVWRGEVLDARTLGS